MAGTSCAQQMRAGDRQHLPLIRDRARWLERLCAQAGPGEVAHIGCADTPYTEERLAAGVLLHQQLLRVARVTGFDIDAPGLDLLSRALPDARFVHADMTAEVPEGERDRYQLVVAGEVLEHVPNGEAFLQGCRDLLAHDGRLCVTVPNACSPKIGLHALTGREVIHPDHRTYYGPRTLARTLRGAGFEPEWVGTCLAPAGRLASATYHPFVRAAHRIFHGPVGEGLIAVAHRS